MTAAPTGIPTIEEAIAALDAEMGKAGARVRKAGDRPRRPTRDPASWIDWEAIAEWCREHPGQAFTADPVHANAVHRFRVRFPDIRVEGSNHRHEPPREGEKKGRRVATFYAVYEGTTDDPDWADA